MLRRFRCVQIFLETVHEGARIVTCHKSNASLLKNRPALSNEVSIIIIIIIDSNREFLDGNRSRPMKRQRREDKRRDP